MEKREPHPSNVKTTRKRPRESDGSSRGCRNPCGCPAAGGGGGMWGVTRLQGPPQLQRGRQHTLFLGRA